MQFTVSTRQEELKGSMQDLYPVYWGILSTHFPTFSYTRWLGLNTLNEMVYLLQLSC
jgi:hypothetical protein